MKPNNINNNWIEFSFNDFEINDIERQFCVSGLNSLRSLAPRNSFFYLDLESLNTAIRSKLTISTPSTVYESLVYGKSLHANLQSLIKDMEIQLDFAKYNSNFENLATY